MVQNSKRSASGFTLTELAIVLGIIGLILGAIWTAAAKVYANNRIDKGVTQILAIVNGVRATFSGKAVLPAGDFTVFAANAGIYPSDMIQTTVTCASGANPCPLNPWNAGVMVGSQTGWAGSPASSARIDILMQNGASGATGALPQGACPAFMAALVGQAASSGLYFIYSDSTGGYVLPANVAITDSHIANCYGNIGLQFTL